MASGVCCLVTERTGVKRKQERGKRRNRAERGRGEEEARAGIVHPLRGSPLSGRRNRDLEGTPALHTCFETGRCDLKSQHVLEGPPAALASAQVQPFSTRGPPAALASAQVQPLTPRGPPAALVSAQVQPVTSRRPTSCVRRRPGAAINHKVKTVSKANG
jgi:hypothetical protein